MDLAGGDVASREAKGPVATVAVEAMKFHHPIELGDVISIYADVEKVGRTSITIALEVFADRGIERTLHKVTEARYIFVALDKSGKPRSVKG